MKIAILGAGRMGSWLARELSRANPVAVYDEDATKTVAPGAATALKDLRGLREFGPEMCINAVSLENTVHAFRQAEEYLTETCILCDVASVKAGVRDYYGRCPFRFVSVHPMFGPTFADMGRLEEEYAVIITESDREAARFFKDFFEGMGVTVVGYSLSDHDRMMAYSLTIPFVSSMAFAACLDHHTVPGATFKKHKIIARGLLSEDDRLLSEILFNPYSLHELGRITARLEFLKHVIKARDYEEAHAFFDALRKNLEEP
jgi:prephenate dehydrogenase